MMIVILANSSDWTTVRITLPRGSYFMRR